jgi:hypothetical protein
MKLNALLIAALSLGTAQAVIISNPLSLQTQYLAGILNGQPEDSNATTEQGYAQTILDLSLGEKTGPAGQEGVFEANTVFDYSGTITFNGGQSEVGIDGDGTIDIPAGWGGALAKYDGQNAGYVLFLFGGTASTIPEFPYTLWTTNQEQYQISHYTLFRGTGDVTPTPTGVVPEGGAGVALLGLVLGGMGLARKVLRK